MSGLSTCLLPNYNSKGMVFQVSPKVVVNPLTADRFNICRYPSPSLHHSNNMGFGEQTWMAGKTNKRINTFGSVLHLDVPVAEYTGNDQLK